MDVVVYVIIGIVVLVLLIVLIWWISTSNKFRTTQVKIDEAMSGIDIALTKRYDTLTKMLGITRDYAQHESDVIMNTIQMRTADTMQRSAYTDKNETADTGEKENLWNTPKTFSTMQERANFNRSMNDAMGRINAVAEQYPLLLSSEVYKQLQIASYDVEEHLQAARRAYNANVSMFNQMLVTFPKSIVAGSMKLRSREFFEAESVKRNDVKISL